MSPRRECPAEDRALKAMTRALIQAVGGLDAAAAGCRVQRSRLHDYQDPNSQGFIPADVLARLEHLAAEPLVTAELARRSGNVLVPVEPIAAGELGELMARIGKEVGDSFGVYADALRDGALTDAEKATLSRELGELMRAATAAQAQLMGRPAIVSGAA